MPLSLDGQCEVLRGGASKAQENPARPDPNPDISGIGVRPLSQIQIAKS